MHVLYVIDNLAAGGAQTSLVAMAPHLVRGGVRLTIASLGEKMVLASMFREAGCDVVQVARSTRAARVRALRRLFLALRPDLVHTTLFESDLAGRLAAQLAGVPVSSTLANEAYGPEHLADPRMRWHKVRAGQILDALTARSAVRLHAVSSRVAETMAGRLAYPRDRIDIVHRGRDAAVLGARTEQRRSAARAGLGIGLEVPLLFTVARHEHQKGLDTAAAALTRVLAVHPTARWVVAGREGNATAALLGQLQAAGTRGQVELLGNRRDVPELMCAADLLLFPTRWEGLPGTILEAMALELPIVASGIPAVREVVDESTAHLVPVDQAVPLADAALAVLADPFDAAARAARARARFEASFTIEAIAAGLSAFWKRCVLG